MLALDLVLLLFLGPKMAITGFYLLLGQSKF